MGLESNWQGNEKRQGSKYEAISFAQFGYENKETTSPSFLSPDRQKIKEEIEVEVGDKLRGLYI